MEAPGRRSRVAFVLMVVAAGLILVVVPTAWLHARGLPWWLCALAGALIFPIAPLGWHLLRERRARADGAKRTLTGSDRLVLRMIAIAVVVLGPLLVLRPGQTWRAVRDHGTWFIPRSPPPPRPVGGDPRLLAQVPAEAELVVWLRSTADLAGGRPDGEAPRRDDEAEEILVAMREGELELVARGPAKALDKFPLDEIDSQLAKQAWLPVEGPLSARRKGDLLIVTTPGWAAAVDARIAGQGAGPTAIIDRLATAPKDAVIIAAGVPARAYAGLQVSGAQSWLRVNEQGVRLDGELVVADRAAATAIVDRLRAELAGLRERTPSDCRRQVGALIDRLTITASDTAVVVRGSWKGEQIGEAMMCGFARALDQK